MRGRRNENIHRELHLLIDNECHIIETMFSKLIDLKYLI